MYIHLLRRLAFGALGATALIMWYPQRFVLGLDLGDNTLQGVVFAVCMLLWALSRGGRLRSDPYFEFRSGIWEVTAQTIAWNMVTIAIELVLLAGLLELGQVFLTRRHAAMGDFFLNALGIITVGLAFYLLAMLGLRTAPGKRLAEFFTTLD